MSDKKDKQRERFTFALFLAAALHSALIFGITFDFEPEPQGTSLLDVTINLTPATEEPESADFIANTNSLASGELDEQREITTDNTASQQGTTAANAAEAQQQLTKGSQKVQGLVTTTNQAATDAPSLISDQEAIGDHDRDQEQVLAEEIAALKAKLDEQKNLYAKRPKIKRLSSMSAKASIEAQYLTTWQQHIEHIGNLNYPEEARTQQLYGELRMLVSMLPDGRLYDAKIIHSSGNRILDRAALDIVGMASPFPSFDKNLLKEYDRLEIIRTWRFERGNRLSNH